MKKILYAVETGGQVYGNQKYGDFTEAFTNSSTEYTITSWCRFSGMVQKHSVF